MHGSRTGRIAMAVLLAAFAACSDDTTDPASFNAFYATINGASVKPTAVVTPGTGSATFTHSGGNITFSVTYSGLRGTVTSSHIHVGGPTQGGGAVQLNLCGAGANFPTTCPATRSSGTFTGTAGAAHLVGGVSMETVLSNMRGYNAYINLHTDTVAAGEVRGNVAITP